MKRMKPGLTSMTMRQSTAKDSGLAANVQLPRFEAPEPAPGRESASRPPAAFELHIEELVLHGFSPNDRYTILDAVEREFTKLLANLDEHSLPKRQRHVERLNGGTFRVAPGSTVRTVGAQVAQALHQSLCQPAGNWSHANKLKIGKELRPR